MPTPCPTPRFDNWGRRGAVSPGGDGAGAGRYLAQMGDLEGNADGLALQLRAHLMTGETDAAEQTARTLAGVKAQAEAA